ncbi:MAG: hypothetical protein AB4290_24390 [Spirulina sp.]
MNASNAPKQGQSHLFKMMLVATLRVMSVAPAMAESWIGYMKRKIERNFGSQAAACVKGFGSGDLGLRFKNLRSRSAFPSGNL